MFYATHKCGKKGMFRVNPENGIVEHDAFSSKYWWDVCYKCRQPIEMKDLNLLYPGVEVVSYSGNDPEYSVANGSLDDCTLQIDGELYIFEVERSGRRGSYPQWRRNWVSKPIEVKADGTMKVPNSHKCGSRYWNEHCWFPIDDAFERTFENFAEFIEIVRKNADEIVRRATDQKYHPG